MHPRAPPSPKVQALPPPSFPLPLPPCLHPPADTRLLFCTPGVLLNRLQSDPTLQGVGCVILDEAHERDISTDFALLVLKKVLQSGSTQAKLVLMSATLQADAFIDYFRGVGASVLEDAAEEDDACRSCRPLGSRPRPGMH